MADISKMKLPNGTTYNIKDSTKLPLAGGTLTGRVTTTKPMNQIITGTGTAATSSGTTYYPAKWTFNTGNTATDGDIVTIKIPVAGSDYGVFMSIDNGTTYYPIVCNSTGRLTTHYPVSNYITVVFEPGGSAASMFPLAGGSSRVTVTGGVWRVINYYDSNSNDIGYYIRSIYPNMKAGTNKVFPYTIIMQLPDGKWESIVTSSSTASSKARNTHGFLLGQVLLMYANATYDGNIATYNIWSRHTGLIDHRYSFNTENNATKGTTGYKPIYLVGALGNDGLFYLDTTWWTQTLPSTADGKLYIYIGDAYDYYRMSFVDNQTIYCYTNGHVRQFTQDAATINGKALPTSASSATTGISIAAHGTGTVTGVQSSTTTASKVTLGTAISITGVQSTTTTASKVTLGTAISVPNVTSAGSASNWVFENITVPKAASSATSIPNVTAVGSGSFTSGAFSGGSGSFSATVTNGVLSFSHTHTAATHGADSHTHTAPTLGTAISVTGVSGSTTASHVKSGGNGTAPTLGTAISIPNVTAATDVTVPIKNTSATSIPNVTAATDVTVPIKNTSASTFVTGTTHTVTDSGHTHNLS